MPRPTRNLFPPFAGVALADILANSAAIVIIMIVVTLMASHEEEEQKLEQAEDVAVLLSRELATSFVMNALPTSPPARLHDYVTWPMDRNPMHAVMPILELHPGHVRDYYTGTVYPRDELLRHDNALDRYLATLTPEQLAAVRIDVYSISEFYIAMSILKAHGTSPRHWHFLGDAPGRSGGGSGAILARKPNSNRPEAGLLDAAAGAGAVASPSTSLPDDVTLAGAVHALDRYPLDDLGIGSGQGGGAPDDEYLELPTAAPGSQSVAGRRPQSGLPGEASSQAPQNESGTRFRVARQAGQSAPSEVSFDLYTALRGLNAYMKSVQADADAGRPSPLPGFDFERDVLRRAGEPVTAAEDQMLRELATDLAAPVENPLDTMTVVMRTDPDLRGQAIAAPANRPLYLAVWLRGPEQEPREGEETTTVTLRLGLHPAIYEGLRVPLAEDGVVLMPLTDAMPDPVPRWRVVTLVNPQVNDFVTGFVFAGIDRSGRLRLPVDENAVEIGGVGVESRFPVVALRGEFRQMLLYGLIALVFALGIVARLWRRA